eukprot:GHVT01069440.1.p1 GENE.GHVT01069440.1~~GHVT01069440.1.p1  ORF type:complete len:663 (+),score=63.07 GHVT01069440.1:357-2345(+)
MGICVECGSSVSHTYREFGKGNIRLTCCDRCGEVADRYVEYDALLILLELILHKEQAYRHILFNRLAYVDRGVDREIVKFAVAIVFFDAYTKWFLFEAMRDGPGCSRHPSHPDSACSNCRPARYQGNKWNHGASQTLVVAPSDKILALNGETVGSANVRMAPHASVMTRMMDMQMLLNSTGSSVSHLDQILLTREALKPIVASSTSPPPLMDSRNAESSSSLQSLGGSGPGSVINQHNDKRRQPSSASADVAGRVEVSGSFLSSVENSFVRFCYNLFQSLSDNIDAIGSAAMRWATSTNRSPPFPAESLSLNGHVHSSPPNALDFAQVAKCEYAPSCSLLDFALEPALPGPVDIPAVGGLHAGEASGSPPSAATADLVKYAGDEVLELDLQMCAAFPQSLYGNLSPCCSSVPSHRSRRAAAINSLSNGPILSAFASAIGIWRIITHRPISPTAVVNAPPLPVNHPPPALQATGLLDSILFPTLRLSNASIANYDPMAYCQSKSTPTDNFFAAVREPCDYFTNSPQCGFEEKHLLILFSAAVELVVYLTVILVAAKFYVWCTHDRIGRRVTLVKYNYLVAAVIISMYGKLGTLLMMIWDCEMALRHPIQFFIITSNVVAVKVFLNCDRVWLAAAIVAVALAARWSCEYFAMQLLSPVPTAACC